MAFSPDGSRLALSGSQAGAPKGTVDIRESATARLLLSLPGQDEPAQGVAFSPDGKLLAVGSNSGTVEVFESETGRLVLDFRDDRPGHHPYWCVAFSPDGKRLAAGYGIEWDKDPGGVRVWDMETGRERTPLSGHPAHALAFDPGGRLATAGLDATARIWDVESGQELLTLRGHKDVLRGIGFTRDGHRLVTVSDDREVRVWDATPVTDQDRLGDELLTLAGHTNCVKALAFHPTRPLLATGSSDGTVRVWDARTGYDPRDVLPTGLQEVHALAFSPDGERLAVVGRPGRECGVRDAATGKLLRRLDMESDEWPHRVAFSPDGKFVAGVLMGGVNPAVLLWDAATGKLTRLEGHRPWVYGVAFGTVAGRPLLASVSTAGEVRIWNPATGEMVTGLEHEAASGVAFSADGDRLATVGWDKVVRVWDTVEWKVVAQTRDSSGGPNGVAFSADGNLLAWGGTDSTVKVWRMGTEEVAILRGHRNWVWDVAFSPDGRQVASASRDATVKIWKTPSFATK